MKIKNIFMILCASAGLSACDFLDFDESQGVTKEEAYGLFDDITAMASSTYREVPSDWGVIGGALREAATDNAVYTWENNSVWNMYNNSWSSLNLVDNRWDTYYNVIHDANSFMENYTEEYLKRYEWTKDYADNMKRVRAYMKEVRVLRAFYHFELAKRFGDIPLLTHTYTLESINKVAKTSFDDVIKYVADECAIMAPELPLNQQELFNQSGHVTRGIALSIRSRALLYAASPFFADEDDASAKWEAAAKAAYDVIKLNYYSLPNISEDPLYQGGDAALKSPQSIWEVRGVENNSFEARNMPIGIEGAQGGNTPTQNLVDDFDMADGTPFDWNNPNHVSNMFYDKEGNPTRDPRLYINVICDGMSYMNTKIESLEGGKNGLPLAGATMTGYYLKKLTNENVSLNPIAPKKQPHHYSVFRYAEILLNYAEAMNEWKGPDGVITDEGGPSLSALDALNKVRVAAGMQAYTEKDKDRFRKLVRKERRIELAFEDHRFWDIRRWKEGSLVKTIYGLTKTDGSYQKQKVQERVWEDKMYLYPIPQKETFVNENLTQNPGW